MEKIDLNSVIEEPKQEPQMEAFQESDPLSRIEEAMMSLHVAAETFSKRIDLLELFVIKLIEKDPELGPRMKEMKNIVNKETKE